MTVTELKRLLERLEQLGYSDKEVEFEVTGAVWSPEKDNAWIDYWGNPLLCEFEKAKDHPETVVKHIDMMRV